MALLDTAGFMAWQGQSYTGDDLRSLGVCIAQVEAALKKLCRGYAFESATLTDLILDAPLGPDLLSPVVPVRGVTSIYYRADGYGVVGRFTSDYLLDNTDGDEYQLVIDDPVNNWSRSGVIRRVGRSGWGWDRLRPLGRLAPHFVPGRGAVKATLVVGHTAVPADVIEVCCLAVAQLLKRREHGAPMGSESWNGWSGSVAGPFSATAILSGPDCAGLLAPYQTLFVG